jgi:hypothetical protein
MYASRLQVFYLLFHFRYHKPETSKEESKTDGKFTFTSEGSQATVEMVDQSCVALSPELTIEDIRNSEESIQFYTGLQNYESFKALYESLVDFGIDSVKETRGPKAKLRLVDEFLMVLMRLRLGLLVKDLEYRFKIAASSVSRIFNKWITFMEKVMKPLVFLPPLVVLKTNVPACFQTFSDTRIILDCTEIFVQTPSSLENQSQTYSNYKSHNTFKALVGISTTGAVVFISKLWGGSASDVEITRRSGLIDMLDSGDAVMVDKGFVHLKSDLSKKGVKLYCPPFKTKDQFTKEEVECTRRIASARIHVERKMEQIKNFRILQGTLPLALSPVADAIFFICSAMTNLLPPLVK